MRLPILCRRLPGEETHQRQQGVGRAGQGGLVRPGLPVGRRDGAAGDREGIGVAHVHHPAVTTRIGYIGTRGREKIPLYQMDTKIDKIGGKARIEI
jgi:hypothetical protein